MTIHSFDTDVARKVGVNAAVIYSNILFWTQKNAANRKNMRDGYVWTYNSRRAFAELFPYLTEKQIRTALEKLVSEGLVVAGSYNQASMDKTNWYAPSCSKEWVTAIGPQGPMGWPSGANGLDLQGQAIPDSKPDTKPDGNLFGVSDETPKPKAKRAVTIPSNWVPSDKNLDDAFNANFTQEEIDHEAAAFRDYHLQKGTAFKDWDAGWRTWLRNSRKFSPAARQDHRAAAKSDALRREIALVATARGAPSEDPF